MSLRLGGDGFQQYEEVLHSVYVASILQCASTMHALLPDGHHRQPTTTLLRAHDVTFSAAWTAQRSKIQRLISQQLQLQRQQRELASLPNLSPAHAAAVHHPLSPDDFAIRQQGLINCLCPESSHWLQANPAFWINRLTDNAFMIAFWVRSKFRVMGPRRYCICGESVDCLGDLVLSYPVSLSGTRLMPRYPINYAGVVAAGEPPLARYLESNLPVIHPAAAANDDAWRAHDPTHPARRAHDPTHPMIHTLARILLPSLSTSRLLPTTLVQQTVLPSLDVLPRLALLPKLPHMPATIVLSLMICSFSSSQ
jgi:hypothetical protein